MEPLSDADTHDSAFVTSLKNLAVQLLKNDGKLVRVREGDAAEEAPCVPGTICDPQRAAAPLADGSISPPRGSCRNVPYSHGDGTSRSL